ncbi:hypothetical protein L9F63_010940, partial [Diploptera punctata]
VERFHNSLRCFSILPGNLIFCILPVSSSRFLHFPTVDGCNATHCNLPLHIQRHFDNDQCTTRSHDDRSIR